MSISAPLFAGVSGLTLEPEAYELGMGVTLKQTYAHFMAPFLMAFSPAPPGKPHPAPWRAMKGGLGFDIRIEIAIAKDITLPGWFDLLNTAWWLTALFRLRVAPSAIVPAVSDIPFTEVRSATREPTLWPMEISTSRLDLAPNAGSTIRIDDLHWLDMHWVQGGMLYNTESEFALAFLAFDQSASVPAPRLALVSLWGALEALFFVGKGELRFRISSLIASFLEGPGEERLKLQKRIAKLYDARSDAAHAARNVPHDMGHLIETYLLMKRVLVKIIESNHVPTREELEGSLFGA